MNYSADWDGTDYGKTYLPDYDEYWEPKSRGAKKLFYTQDDTHNPHMGSQFTQLSMWERAGDIMKSHSVIDGDRVIPMGTDHMEMALKHDEATTRNKSGQGPAKGKASLAANVRKHGIQHPISLEVPRRVHTVDHFTQNDWNKEILTGGQVVPPGSKPKILGGHHRLAVQLAHNPDAIVPVTWHDTIDQARSQKVY
jgi:hypothetical protein